jgi:di/tripeptidase
MENLLLKTQPELKNYLFDRMTSFGYNVIRNDDEHGYLKCECENGHASLLIAHLDTVYNVIPNDVRMNGNIITGYDKNGNRSILGGDDRCGVYIILKLIINGFRPQVLFTEDEETGCCGANAFVRNKEAFTKHIKYCIQIDRGIRGNENNYVDYGVSTDEFDQYIESLGFSKEQGSSSDVRHIAPYLDVPGVNVCAGYDNEHRTEETIDMEVVESTYNKLCLIFK